MKKLHSNLSSRNSNHGKAGYYGSIKDGRGAKYTRIQETQEAESFFCSLLDAGKASE